MLIAKVNLNNNNEIKLELLAPAGGFEQLEAAINFGADAVYLGLENFSMRARAKNFSYDELKKAVEFCHKFGILVYVTINTMIKEGDLKALQEALEATEQTRADAVIVGDLAALVLTKKFAPSSKIHVSTQASVANSVSAKSFYDMGASRVVLARELQLSEIANIIQNSPRDLEFEVFAHGAQCMAESGRCLISSYLCDRSANEGNCTQPCRWGYQVVEEKRPSELFDIEEANGMTYLFNAKDLCMIEHLRELESSGVDSIKIEGRNKKAFYVATVVGAYKNVLQGGDVQAARQELETISHRPYSCGFYFGNPEQSLNFDGYSQKTQHVADVLDCKKADDKFFAHVLCRNKIEKGDAIEVLSANLKVDKFCAGNIWIKENNGELLPVEVVNIPGREYIIELDFNVNKGSFMRKRIDITTSRY